MLTPADIRSVQLYRRPLGQRLLADLVVRPYHALRGVHVVVEGWENLPVDKPVIVAMNHTDRYNYLGFQVELHKQRRPYLAAWVKGKYYEKSISRVFMRSTSNIPVPSRGYVLVGLFRQHVGRKPTATEYRNMRDLVDGVPQIQLGDDLRRWVGGDIAGWVQHVEAAYQDMANEVVTLTGRAFDVGMQVQIFPEGTRSITVQRGHSGIAQIAQYFQVPIVPVGCSGSHKVYPNSSPWPRPGTITYRIGPPIFPDAAEVAMYQVKAPFQPMSRAAQKNHGPQFQGIVDVVMDRIRDLVDPDHIGPPAPAVNDVDRFIV